MNLRITEVIVRMVFRDPNLRVSAVRLGLGLDEKKIIQSQSNEPATFVWHGEMGDFTTACLAPATR